ncbi:hypothetical protein OAG67_01865 [bacterium]|nr:hypothetical protein [Akkermansiaceae bacterium]MDB4761870.1 hypothetical protein [bacterium]
MSDLYNDWAIALTKHFFGPHMAGKRTRLTVNEQLLNEEFGYLGGFQGFVSAVKNGPIWVKQLSPNSIHDAAKLVYDIWKKPVIQRPKDYPPLPNDSPPYLPYLALLCLGWATDDEDLNLSAHNFYERLELVLEDHGLKTPLLKNWRIYWEELENWSAGFHGELGIWKLEYIYWKHVGIPYSQTILTSSKLRKLPWLFHITHLSIAVENGLPSKEQLRATLLQFESYTKQALGIFLTENLKDSESKIGDKTLSLLVEQLEEPENRIYDDQSQLQSSRTNQKNERIEKLNLRVIIEFNTTKNQWHLGYGLLEDQAPTRYSESHELHFVKEGTSHLGVLWMAYKNDSPDYLSGNEIDRNSIIETDFESEGENGRSLIALSTQKREVRIFRSNFTSNYIIEEYNLPTAGDCYLLSNSESKKALDNWLAEFVSLGGEVSSQIPQTGLPSFLTIHYVNRLEKAPPEFLNRFPDSRTRTISPTYISFVGGSRIIGAGSERRYLGYDLPTVVLEVRDEAYLNVIGAEITPATNHNEIQSTIPRSQVQEYDLLIQENTSSITLEAINRKTKDILETRTIAVTNHLLESIRYNQEDEINFDRFGMVSNESGIFGCSIKSTSHDKSCDQIIPIEDYRQDFDSDNRENKDGIRDERWKILESLLVKRRFTGQEFKRKVERIIGDWPTYGWAELQTLQALGHLEVERDKKGRIAYIYHVKASAFKLPWSKGSDSLFGIAGCPSFGQLTTLKQNSIELGLRFSAYERHRSTLPPLIIIEGDEESIQLCLADANFSYQGENGGPATSTKIAQWSGSLKQREDAFQWQAGIIQDPEAVFNPFRFLMLSPESFNCPYKLFLIPDSYSQQNKWHAIVKTAGASDLDERGRHVFLSDLSWGKWLTLKKATLGIPPHIECFDDENIPIPYDSKHCQLIVPASLRFPTLLYRALLMCSGMPPTVVKQSQFFSKAESEFLPDEDIPYTSSCHIYQSVPLEIAKLICQKVSAWPIDLNLLQNRTLETNEESDYHS